METTDTYGAKDEGPCDDDLPVVDGLTVTQPDTESLHVRLADFMAQRPGGSTSKLVELVSGLESAFESESNPQLRSRLAAARSLLINGPTLD